MASELLLARCRMWRRRRDFAKRLRWWIHCRPASCATATGVCGATRPSVSHQRNEQTLCTAFGTPSLIMCAARCTDATSRRCATGGQSLMARSRRLTLRKRAACTWRAVCGLDICRASSSRARCSASRPSEAPRPVARPLETHRPAFVKGRATRLFIVVDTSVRRKKQLCARLRRAHAAIRFPVSLQWMDRWHDASGQQLLYRDGVPQILDLFDVATWPVLRYQLRRWAMVPSVVPGCVAIEDAQLVSPTLDWRDNATPVLVLLEGLASAGWTRGAPPRAGHTLHTAR